MFGKRVIWSPVELDYLKKHRKDPIHQLTIALAKSVSAVKKQLTEIKKGTAKAGPASGKGGRQKFNIGKRKDCNNLFFRSSYEANVYRWFQHTKLHHIHGGLSKIEYEPQCFTYFEFGHKSGTTSYIPDFKLTFKDGTEMWVEVKGGYMKAQDKTKIRRFQKYYPCEFRKLAFITSNAKSKSSEFFISLKIPLLAYYHTLRTEFADIIPNWE